MKILASANDNIKYKRRIKPGINIESLERSRLDKLRVSSIKNPKISSSDKEFNVTLYVTVHAIPEKFAAMLFTNSYNELVQSYITLKVTRNFFLKDKDLL